MQTPPLITDDESTTAKTGDAPPSAPLPGAKPIKRLAANRPESVKFR